MTPLPQNPTVVLQVSKDGTAVIRKASNIDRDMTVILVDNEVDFLRESSNQPFSSVRPVQPTQPLNGLYRKNNP